MNYEEIKPNGTQILGGVLLIAAIFVGFGGLQYVMAYMDTTPAGEYRGYDLYYLPNINVYGADTGEEVGSWPFASSLDALRGIIDNWLDSPLAVIEYEGYVVYQEAGGAQRYYAEKDGSLATGYYWTFDEAISYIDELEDIEDPVTVEEPTTTGTTDTTGTIGQKVLANEMAITAGMGGLGLGLFALGTVKEDEK